jgi:type VI protein secretion system component Hcp
MGKRFAKATLIGRKNGDRPVDYLTITLSDAMLSSYQQSGTTGEGAAPMEQVSCVVGKIYWNIGR